MCFVRGQQGWGAIQSPAYLLRALPGHHPMLFGPGEQYDIACDLIAGDQAVRLAGLTQRQGAVEQGFDLALSNQLQTEFKILDITSHGAANFFLAEKQIAECPALFHSRIGRAGPVLFLLGFDTSSEGKFGEIVSHDSLL